MHVFGFDLIECVRSENRTFTIGDIRPKKNMHVCGYPTVPAKKYRPYTFLRENLQKRIEDLSASHPDQK